MKYGQSFKGLICENIWGPERNHTLSWIDVYLAILQRNQWWRRSIFKILNFVLEFVTSVITWFPLSHDVPNGLKTNWKSMVLRSITITTEPAKLTLMYHFLCIFFLQNLWKVKHATVTIFKAVSCSTYTLGNMRTNSFRIMYKNAWSCSEKTQYSVVIGKQQCTLSTLYFVNLQCIISTDFLHPNIRWHGMLDCLEWKCRFYTWQHGKEAMLALMSWKQIHSEVRQVILMPYYSFSNDKIIKD